MLILFRKMSSRARNGTSSIAKKTVLITGTSSGIGKASALYLAERGCHVIGTSRSIDRLEDLKKEMSDKGFSFTPVELDINRNEAVNRVMPSVIREHGTIDALVNNAGYGLWGPVESLSMTELKTLFEANFFAAVRMIQAVLQGMIEQRSGTIVNVSSVLGRMGTPFNGAYAASKFAMEGMSESLRAELSPFGVRVALVEPGLFNTSFQDNAVVSEKADSEELAYAPYIRSYRKNHDRFQRFGDDPIKVARVIHKIIASPNPAFRNPVGIEARAGIFGTRVLPEKIYWPLLTRATLK